ncbi:hypothetical protein SAMN02746095_02936 [Acidocella aminolytica 101 = DSM 11237]|uniref:Uncharacterized protein n=1 Tax=Acidocella aminolytica 101 = DSM 11237 TaxID=1120923 RepID=A0A0D6PDR2_9PROT|nr:hypothetical protein [Acidocella aminolytica]GAN79797.1 hypothetical protein Aam_030_030 [Acidocella aminolytica 101 = DSM 11237]GBQ32084.1 hypothetical protein AA11237_0065 [Acidocella aminolytica 101 = DSM 11237]SHF35437.1 hypothetical protein SAMN02746095_02936 [Acidocella aminolytica 101 = DSM 11237]
MANHPNRSKTARSDSAAEFYVKLQKLFGEGAQSALARALGALGDRRTFKARLLSISRMATGVHAVSGEMQAIVTLLGMLTASERSALASLENADGYQPHSNDRSAA